MKHAKSRLLTALLILSSVALAQTSPSVIAAEVPYDQAPYYNHTSHIARSSNDDLVAVWTAPGDATQIVFSKYDDAFMTWSAPVAISTSLYEAHKAGIAADENGNLFAVWQQRDSLAQDWRIFISTYAGVSWSTPLDISGDSTENEEASIGVADDGTIHVAWNTDGESNGAEFILSKHSSDGGNTWSTPPDTLNARDGVIGGTSTTSGRPVIAAATGGKMVATWHEEPDERPDREVFVCQYDGTSWGDEMYVADSTDGELTLYPTIAVDRQDMIYCIYNPMGEEKLLLKKKAWADTEWPLVPDTVINYMLDEWGMDEYYPYKPYLGIVDDNLYLVYRCDMAADTVNGFEEINYVTSDDGGATWSTPARLSREGHDAGYTTLAPTIRASGVDVFWRENSFITSADDSDTLDMMYGHIDLLVPWSVENDDLTASSFSLNQNYPNPFNPSTNMSFAIQRGGEYELAVYNLLGQKVRTLVSRTLTAGDYNVSWDGTDAAGERVSSGIYFYRLSGANHSMVRKMILMR